MSNIAINLDNMFAGSFSPSNLSGLTLWLRADMGITLNGSTVSRWADMSGNGHDATQASAGSQPTYNATGSPLGTPIVTFPAVAFMATNAITVDSCTYAITAHGPNNGVSGIVFERSPDSNANPGEWMLSSTTNGPNMHVRRTVTATSSNDFATFLQDGNWHWAALDFNTASGFSGYRDSLTPYFTTADIDSSPSAQALNIAARAGPGFLWVGDIRELILYNRNLSASELSALYTYMRAQVGI